jgi:hypothetical protein
MAENRVRGRRTRQSPDWLSCGAKLISSVENFSTTG